MTINDTESSILEPTALDNLASFLSTDKLYELFSRYLSDSQQIIKQLEIALNQEDAASTTRLVHSLKSTSANIGAARLSELAKSLEGLAHEKKLDEINGQMDALVGLFDQTRKDIEQLDVMQG